MPVTSAQPVTLKELIRQRFEEQRESMGLEVLPPDGLGQAMLLSPFHPTLLRAVDILAAYKIHDDRIGAYNYVASKWICRTKPSSDSATYKRCWECIREACLSPQVNLRRLRSEETPEDNGLPVWAGKVYSYERLRQAISQALVFTLPEATFKRKLKALLAQLPEVDYQDLAPDN